MKILIACDMEGISGVVDWDQVDSHHAEYTRCRKLMTEDVNAAIEGAFEAGADEVIVTDGHANGRNILIEELDARARLHQGFSTALAMVEGVQNSVDGVLFIGYHARSGAQHSTLEHTWSGKVIDVSLNNVPHGEIGLNAAVCGYYNVPVLMISGDQVACGEAMELLGNVETAVVKKATGRFSALLIPPAQTCKMICEAAANGVLRLRQGTAVQPYKVPEPVTLAVTFAQSQMADQAAVMPGVKRNGRRLEYQAEDMLVAYRAFQTIAALAS
jgi:D-amino peptidase